MKKRLFIALALAIPTLTGCDMAKTVTVSTAKELLDVSGKDRKIVLESDIDFDYQTLSAPISIHSIEGNNHKIKNVVVHTVNNINTSLFTTKDEKGVHGKISNLVLDDVTITGDSTNAASFVSAFAFKEFENIQINNCTLSITGNKQSSCVVGSISGGSDPREINYKKKDEVTVKNCKVSNSKIIVQGPSSGNPALYVSGIAGDAESISKCLVDNLTIEVNGGYLYQDIRIGGISSHAQGNIDNCEVKNSNFSGTNTWHGSNILGTTNVSEIQIGGIYSNCSRGNGVFETTYNSNTISFCTAHDNILTAKTYGDVRSGGISAFTYGVINNCVAYNNEIRRLKLDNTVDKHFMGGIVGNAVKGTITSTISYDNQIIDEINSGKSEEESAGGIFGAISSTIIKNSASGINTIQQVFADEFGPSSSNISDCYISNNQYLNSNNLPILNRDEFKDSSSMMVKLLLNAPQWDFSNDMPTLQLGL